MAAPSSADTTASQRELDSDLDPAAFLKSVRELSEKREREDAERFRKLEEEVQQSRQERAARRAERARSISPEKPTPRTPTSRGSPRPTANVDIPSAPPPLTPSGRTRDKSRKSTPQEQTAPRGDMEKDKAEQQPSAGAESVPEFKGFGSMKRSSTASTARSSAEVQPVSADSSTSSTLSATHLARSGTLSWQQRRPTSRYGGSRPASMVDPENANIEKSASTQEPEASREQVAASLSTRDPSWFKQTAERGLGSAAYRKSKDEAAPSPGRSQERRGLPGLSRESSMEPESQQGSPRMANAARSDAAPKFDSIRQKTALSSSRYSTTSTTSSKPDLKSLVAADKDQQMASPSFDRASSTDGDQGSGLTRTPSMSSSQARLSGVVDRPPSPTKGMGGFVQSAMLRRSDSQSKRWSAHPGGSLSRQNSIVNSRLGLGGLQGSHSMPKLEPTPGSRESSHEPLSRPTSSSNHDLPSLATTAQRSSDNDGFVKPTLPHHSRSKSVASNYSVNDEGGTPGSPSKRFSPTKSSWIESALTKPELPKPAASKNAQPGWMANLAKANAQKPGAESSALGTDTPKSEHAGISRSGSPVKTTPTPFGPSLLKRSESRDLANPISRPGTPVVKLKPAGKLEMERAGSTTGTPLPVSNAPQKSEKTEAPQDLSETRTPSTSTEQPSRGRMLPPVAPAVAKKPEISLLERKQALQSKSSEFLLKEKSQPSRSSSPAVSKDDTPATPEPNSEPPFKSFKPSPQIASRPKPETPPKPTTDFRSALKSRPQADAKTAAEPEFLSKFGQLRKTQQEKYVAPDVLKANIMRGKSDLAATGGPVKTARKDELKESLLAKKDDIKQAIEQGRELPGQTHERKISGLSGVLPPMPAKPEALAKREMLGRAGSGRTVVREEREREGTPEALARHKSLRQKPVVEPKANETTAPASTAARFEPLDKQISAPAAMETKAQDTSRLAARFNPGLAGLLARGPPSNPPSRTGTPSNAQPERVVALNRSATDEGFGDSAQLHDVRKDRAKGPKRRKGGAHFENASVRASPVIEMENPAKDTIREMPISPSTQSTPVRKEKPQAVPGSAAALMSASLKKGSRSDPVGQEPASPVRPTKLAPETAISQRPIAPAKSPSLQSTPATAEKSAIDRTPTQTPVPEFKGFGSARKSSTPVSKPDEDKENTSGLASLPSVKAAALTRGRASPEQPKSSASMQTQLPTKRDHDAAMRSAGLLASSPGSTGLGISVEKRSGSSAALTPPTSAGFPPKPTKSSRVVSGQLLGGSEEKDQRSYAPPLTEAGRQLFKIFDYVPKSQAKLSVDTQEVLARLRQDEPLARILRRSVQILAADGRVQKSLPPGEEYTLYDAEAYICTLVYADGMRNGKSASVTVWAGASVSEAAVETALTAARRIARENSAPPAHFIRQGHETPAFLHALSGILITRCGEREGAATRYMLCGRKHLGFMVFDEVRFAAAELCQEFVYLIAVPRSLLATDLWLWKGAACSAEEVSAARLVAVDLLPAGEVVEVSAGAEESEFLRIFGATTTRVEILGLREVWQSKALAPERFETKFLRIQLAEPSPTGFIASLWSRRPSWSTSPARAPADEDVRVEVVPTTPLDLDPAGLYFLDAYSATYLLVGPLFPSAHAERVRTGLFVQALLFAAEYVALAAQDGRPCVPRCVVVSGGIPENVSEVVRGWDGHGRGVWGTAGLMAGSAGKVTIGLEDALGVVHQG